MKVTNYAFNKFQLNFIEDRFGIKTEKRKLCWVSGVLKYYCENQLHQPVNIMQYAVYLIRFLTYISQTCRGICSKAHVKGNGVRYWNRKFRW